MPIIFEPYKHGETELYYRLVRELQVMRYITERALSTAEAEGEFNEILAYNQNHQDGSGYFKVFAGESYLGFSKIAWNQKNELEVGYMISPEFWQQGYGQQILTKLLVTIQANSALAKAPVFAIIDPSNEASKHILTKNNFKTTWQGVEAELPTEYLYLVRD